MHSEFQEVELDRVRYSLVWEGSETLYKGLDIQTSDKVLVITSAGCNVLNALLKDPAELVAIDLNPVQNCLLKLKLHIIEHHDHLVFRGLMGFDGRHGVDKAWAAISGTLEADRQAYWSSFFHDNPDGIIMAGKLEKYLTGFIGSLESSVQENLRTLTTFTDIGQQQKFFMEELHGTSFRPRFIEYFDRQNLSKGRDPRLFRYAGESGGESFYLRLMQQMGSQLAGDNFFFRFFFFGPLQLPESILPPCYRKENFLRLKEMLPKLKIVNGEAIDYLLSEEGRQINKASLSNIFEYTSEQEFRAVCHTLFEDPCRKLRAVFWNLLQDQGASDGTKACESAVKEELSDNLSRQEACFYFRNVRLLDTVSVPLQV